MKQEGQMLEQLRRYYSLWRETNAIYKEWAIPEQRPGAVLDP